jgi:hypothetical protein
MGNQRYDAIILAGNFLFDSKTAMIARDSSGL